MAAKNKPDENSHDPQSEKSKERVREEVTLALCRAPGIGLQEIEKIVLRIKDLVARGFFTETDRLDICSDARNFWLANDEADWLEKTGVVPPRYNTLEELEKIYIPWWKEKAAFAGIDATTILTPDNNGVPWWKILGINHGIEESELREVDREGILEKTSSWKPIIMGALARQKRQKALAGKGKPAKKKKRRRQKNKKYPCPECGSERTKVTSSPKLTRHHKCRKCGHNFKTKK